MTHHLNNNPRFHLDDALYCSEEHWDEHHGADQSQHEDHDECYIGYDTPTKLSPVMFEHDLLWDDEELASLMAKERENQLYTLLEANPFLVEARREGIEWILKVNAHYSFSPLTAVLAVNYLDRFLFHFQVQDGKPWMTHLAAVACLSLAAKVEETHVPLLLDLQVCSVLLLLLFPPLCFVFLVDSHFGGFSFFYLIVCRWRIASMCLKQRP